MNNLEKYILEILLIKLDLLTNLTLKGCEVSSYIKSLINLDKSLKNNPEKFINLYQDDIIQETNRIKYYFDEEFTNKPHKNPLTFKLELIHHITDILI